MSKRTVNVAEEVRRAIAEADDVLMCAVVWAKEEEIWLSRQGDFEVFEQELELLGDYDYTKLDYIKGYLWFEDGSWCERTLEYAVESKNCESYKVWTHRRRPSIPFCLID